MQYGQRTQNAAANKSRHAGAPSLGQLEHGLGSVDSAQISAARLAAEAAFEPPRPSVTQNGQAQITVRRVRLLAVGQLEATPVVASADTSGPKQPRVFRVEAARIGKAGQFMPTPQTKPDLGPDGQATSLKSRKRLVAAEQRPGPVVLTRSAVASLPPQPEVAAPSSEALGVRLEQITPILAAIQRAQTVWFIDDRDEVQWRRLSVRADKLLRQLTL